MSKLIIYYSRTSLGNSSALFGDSSVFATIISLKSTCFVVIRAAFVTARKFPHFKERLPANVDRSFLIIYAALSAELRRFRLAETWQRLNRTDTIKVSVVFSPHMHRTFFGTSPRPCLSGVSPARVAAVRRLLLLLYLLIPARPTASGGQECWLLLKRKNLGKPLLATD